MAGEPILGKHPPLPQWDHKPMTWARFLRLRAWARAVADQEGAPVYLVGSALSKAVPRDLDVSIILPHDRFVARFGPIPPNAETAAEHLDAARMPAYLARLQHYLGSPPRCYQQSGMRAIRDRTRLDLKICPDSWWPEKDKLLLAAPAGGPGMAANPHIGGTGDYLAGNFGHAHPAGPVVDGGATRAVETAPPGTRRRLREGVLTAPASGQAGTGVTGVSRGSPRATDGGAG